MPGSAAISSTVIATAPRSALRGRNLSRLASLRAQTPAKLHGARIPDRVRIGPRHHAKPDERDPHRAIGSARSPSPPKRWKDAGSNVTPMVCPRVSGIWRGSCTVSVSPFGKAV